VAVETKPTTLTLPADLVAALDRAVTAGDIPSRDAFVAGAIRRELATIEAVAIDAAFAEMAADDTYHDEVRRLTAEFAEADREAWRLAESS